MGIRNYLNALIESNIAFYEEMALTKDSLAARRNMNRNRHSTFMRMNQRSCLQMKFKDFFNGMVELEMMDLKNDIRFAAKRKTK